MIIFIMFMFYHLFLLTRKKKSGKGTGYKYIHTIISFRDHGLISYNLIIIILMIMIIIISAERSMHCSKILTAALILNSESKV